MKAIITIFETFDSIDEKVYGILLTVGVQTFEINGETKDDKDHAFKLAKMLSHALENTGTKVEIKKKIKKGRF